MIASKASWLCALALLAAGCGSDEAAVVGPGPEGSTNVSQGGAQDFDFFRTLVEQGEVPSPDLLDPVGFFAEHAMDLPAAECKESICIQPMLAVAPRFDGSNWTMAFVAMNTPVDPADLERPDVHMVIAIERGAWLDAFRPGLEDGLELMMKQLRPEDRVSIVSFGRTSEQHVVAALPAESLIAPIVAGLSAADAVSPYDGLAAASRAIDAASDVADLAHRVVLIGTGRADAGVTDPERIVGLGAALVKRGAALGLVGVNQDYDARLPSALGSLGAGTFSFAGDSEDLERVLEIEGETTVFPLATDLELSVEPAPGYRVGRIYGVKRATVLGGAATFDLPAVFIGQREGAKDTAGGRRGGGGGLFVELIADVDSDVGPGEPAFHVSASWRSASGEEESADIDVENPLAPGDNPDGLWWLMSHPQGEKAFMMLNMYLSLRLATVLFHGGDCPRTLGVSDMMMPMIEGWQGKFADPDILSDTDVLLRLRENARVKCEGRGPVVPIRPVQSSEGGCGML